MSLGIAGQDIPREVLELCQRLTDAGYRVWIVGGCLRDVLLGRSAADWDLATDARPEQVQKVFPRVLLTGVQHGTVTVRHRGKSFEVTTLRGEGTYSDGRRPDSVAFVEDIEQDLARRDFTVNAMAYDPLAQVLVDPFSGRADLARRCIRAVGDAHQRFSEDGLRVLRAARFCATLEFTLEPATEAAIPATLSTFAKVSAERVREEWLKALKANHPAPAFRVMRDTGILAVTFVELAELPAEVFTNGLSALDTLPRTDPILRLSALLWPLAAERALLSDWLTRYRFSNHERERVVKLTGSVRPELAREGDPALRRFAREVGRDHLTAVTMLCSALTAAHRGTASEDFSNSQLLHTRLTQLITPDTPLTQRELNISGGELMEALALTPGPVVGGVLEQLLESVLDDPQQNVRETLLELARKML